MKYIRFHDIGNILPTKLSFQHISPTDDEKNASSYFFMKQYNSFVFFWVWDECAFSHVLESWDATFIFVSEAGNK